MVKNFKRLLIRLLPEILSAYHMPRLARVVAVNDSPEAGGIGYEFRPRYAVDVELLDTDFNPVPESGVFEAVPLPVSFAGQGRGFWGIPEEGTLVILGFIQGAPNRPFIQNVLSTRSTLGEVKKGESQWQGAANAWQRADAAGNWERITAGTIADKSTTRTISAADNTEQFDTDKKTVTGNSVLKVNGSWLTRIFGTVKLLAGGMFNISAGENLNLTTASDLNVAAAGNINQNTKGDVKLGAGGKVTETITGDKETTAANQTIKGAKIHLGSDSDNLLKLVSDLMVQVNALTDALFAHGHGEAGAGPPTTAANITAVKTAITPLKTKLDAMTK